MAGCMLFEIAQPKEVYKIRIRTEIPYRFGRKIRTDSDGNSARIRTELVRTFRENSGPIRTDSFYMRGLHRRGFSDVGYCHFIYTPGSPFYSYKMAKTF